MTQFCLATVQELTREWVSFDRMCKCKDCDFFGGEGSIVCFLFGSGFLCLCGMYFGSLQSRISCL